MPEIRPEARPVSWDKLDEGQQEALIRIIKMIHCALPMGQPKPPSSHHSSKPYISEDRSSRLAFLDGARGTGKSTILMTLLKFIIEGFDKSSDTKPSEEDLSKIEDIHQRVVWLEPIDMEPTPKNWNMLPAILARIEQAYNRYYRSSNEGDSNQNNYSGLLDPSHHYHDSMRELRQLQNNVALSWDGNLNDRASQLDPDSYALETMRIERARLELNPNISKVLDSIAYTLDQTRSIKNPLFILPIDDFDLNPVVCLELLRVLRMLSIPRLFTVMLGDLEIVDVVLNLKISNDLNTVCPEIRAEMLSITSNYVAMTAGRIAADSIHKLLPPMQCIKLQPMHAYEALNFSPLGESSCVEKPYLYQKLEDCSMDFGPHIQKNKNSKNSKNSKPPYGVTNIAGFLIARGRSVVLFEPRVEDFQCRPEKGKKIYQSSDIVNKYFYSGLQMMNTVPRYVNDIWFTFNRFIEFSKNEKWETKVGLIAELCQNILLRDGVLDPLTRSQTRSGFFNDQLGGWDLEALPVITRSVIDNGKTCLNPQNSFVIENEGTNLHCHFNAFKALGWRFQLISINKKLVEEENATSETIKSDRQTSKNIFETNQQISDVHGIQYHQLGKDFVSTDHLGTDTSGALILFHDLLALGSTYRSHSFLLKPGIKHVDNKAWCLTTWQKGLARKVQLAWYRPRCHSFWGLDLFRYAWNDFLQKKIELTPEELVFTWISAGTGVILNEEPITITSKGNTENTENHTDDWKKIGEKLNKLAGNSSELVDDQVRLWLIGIALMIMPETGLPKISSLYKNQKELANFWKHHARSIRNHREERLTKVYEANMQGLAKQFYNGKPYDFFDSQENSDPDNDNNIDLFRPYEFGKRVKSHFVGNNKPNK